MAQSQIRFGEFLANMQASIFTMAFKEIGMDWTYSNQKFDLNLLYFVTAGSCQIHIRDETLQLQAGDLALLPAGVVLRTHSESEAFAKYYCHFSAMIGETSIFDMMQLSYVVTNADPREMNALFAQLLDAYTTESMTAALRSKAALYHILSRYIDASDHCELLESNSVTMEQMNRVISYIENHLADKLTVDHLAGLVHLHPHYFNDVFKTFMGCTPIQYITKLRYERAKVLLATTKRSLTEIAEAIGIAPDYFTKFFKHHAGFSPSNYRNHYKLSD